MNAQGLTTDLFARTQGENLDRVATYILLLFDTTRWYTMYVDTHAAGSGKAAGSLFAFVWTAYTHDEAAERAR